MDDEMPDRDLTERDLRAIALNAALRGGEPVAANVVADANLYLEFLKGE